MEDKGYLFCYFTGERLPRGEQIYFALSTDGLHWHDLNGGAPVLESHSGTGGVRDPFLLHSRVDGAYYILATDLCIYKTKSWNQAVTAGSRDILLWKSENLTDWTPLPAWRVPLEKAGCIWAPEAVYDEESKDYLVFWAAHTPGADGVAKHRIYAAHTSDFETFSLPRLYMEDSDDVIDTDIVEEDGVYYRFSKNEKTKCLLMEKSTSLSGEFERVDSPVLAARYGLEGPTAFYLARQKQWCLLADRFAEAAGYLPLVTDSLASGAFRILPDAAYDMGRTRKRHGSVLTLNAAEYAAVRARWGRG